MNIGVSFFRRTHYIIALIVLIVAGSCTQVPITGRRQLSLLPESMLVNMAFTSYQEFMAANAPLPTNDPRVQRVRAVGERISQAVHQYLVEHGETERIESLQWQFNVVENEAINAWVMPGGKVMFYTGILPLMTSDDYLAVVMAHEVAHVIARHGNERMSQQLVVMLGAVSLEVALMERPEETRNLFLLAYGVGGQLGTLAYSRRHELEADRLGMIFMAMAGYNPEAAVSFWELLHAQAGRAEPPQFLSTHPTSAARINAARQFVPEAMQYKTTQ